MYKFVQKIESVPDYFKQMFCFFFKFFQPIFLGHKTYGLVSSIVKTSIFNTTLLISELDNFSDRLLTLTAKE